MEVRQPVIFPSRSTDTNLLWEPGRINSIGFPGGNLSRMATLSTSSPRIMSMASIFSRSKGPSPFLIPGIKQMGMGQISGREISAILAASSFTPAGAVIHGTTTSPTSEVIMPLPMIRCIWS